MSKKIFSIIQYIFFLGGGLFLVWWQFHVMTAEQMEKFKFAITNANFLIIIPIVFMSLASHLSRAIRWNILIEPLGYKPAILNTFGVTMVGYLANSFVPRLGEILKCTLLSKYEKIPFQKLVGTIVIERVFDFCCFLLFILFTILIQFKLVGGFVQESIQKIISNNTGLPIWLKGSIAIVGVIIFLLLVRWVLNKFAHINLIQKIKKFIAGLAEGIASIKNLNKKGWFLFHTFFIWSMYLLQIYVGFMSIQEISHLSLSAACSVLTLSTFAMILTPGGIGTFPTAIFLVLQLYKVEQHIGEAFGWLMWGTNTVIIIVFGLLMGIVLVRINKSKVDPAKAIEKSLGEL